MQTSAQQRDYHAARARAELESAFRAASPHAVALHLELSALHLRNASTFGPSVGQQGSDDLLWMRDFASVHRRWLKGDLSDDQAADRREWSLHDAEQRPCVLTDRAEVRKTITARDQHPILKRPPAVAAARDRRQAVAT